MEVSGKLHVPAASIPGTETQVLIPSCFNTGNIQPFNASHGAAFLMALFLDLVLVSRIHMGYIGALVTVRYPPYYP
jgi:hypothetical protein